MADRVNETDPWGYNSPEQPQGVRGGIQNAYKNWLGRDARPDEIDFHSRTSPDNYDEVIKNSSEAQAWSQRQQSGGGTGQTQNLGAPTNYNRAALKAAIQGAGKGFNLKDFLAKNAGGFAQGVTSDDRGEWITLPDGEKMDVVGDVGGQNIAWWGSEKDWQQENAGKPQSGGGGSQYVGPPGGQIGGGGGTAQTDPLRDFLIKKLMAQADQSTTIDKNDPNFRNQADTFRAQTDRSQRNYMADLAEKAGPLANLRGEGRVAAERAGQTNAAFESQLVGRELTARRDEIQNALQMLSGRLTADQQLNLTKQLADIDAALRSRGLDLGYAQMNNSNDQFLASLGLQSENQGNYWDAVRKGLL